MGGGGWGCSEEARPDGGHSGGPGTPVATEHRDGDPRRGGVGLRREEDGGRGWRRQEQQTPAISTMDWSAVCRGS